MIKYKAHFHCSLDVECVNVTRETASSVWVEYRPGKSRREARRTSGTRFFDTFEEAKAFLSGMASVNIEAAKYWVSVHEEQLIMVKGMESPKLGEATWLRRI